MAILLSVCTCVDSSVCVCVDAYVYNQCITTLEIVTSYSVGEAYLQKVGGVT